MQNVLPLTFERNLYRAVIRFKEDHPGVLEARTKLREMNNVLHQDQLQEVRTANHNDSPGLREDGPVRNRADTVRPGCLRNGTVCHG